ncbi:MAG: TIGR00730 family Rossman fold protein [Anaerolineales bacterium]|nr:TIGR00730 family Rossman fold protein [Anaerolineales bacterium]
MDFMRAICIFCGSSDSVHSDYMSAARSLGILLADKGIRLVYGGGKTGLMGAVADGALSAGGEVIGVIIPSMNTPVLAHDGLTRMDVPLDMHARKARMHELVDGYIALPGGFGTFDELFETITWAQTGAHQKPVGLLNVKNYYAPLLAAIDHAVAEGFIFKEHRNSISIQADPNQLLDAMGKYEHPHEAVKRWMREDQ